MNNNNNPIRPQFCTCHDSSDVVACAKLWPDSITMKNKLKKKIIKKKIKDFDYELIKCVRWVPDIGSNFFNNSHHSSRCGNWWAQFKESGHGVAYGRLGCNSQSNPFVYSMCRLQAEANQWQLLQIGIKISKLRLNVIWHGNYDVTKNTHDKIIWVILGVSYKLKLYRNSYTDKDWWYHIKYHHIDNCG